VRCQRFGTRPQRTLNQKAANKVAGDWRGLQWLRLWRK